MNLIRYNSWDFLRFFQLAYQVNVVYGVKTYLYVDDGFGNLIPHTNLSAPQYYFYGVL